VYFRFDILFPWLLQNIIVIDSQTDLKKRNPDVPLSWISIQAGVDFNPPAAYVYVTNARGSEARKLFSVRAEKVFVARLATAAESLHI